jgi:hypothetical protein
MELIQLWGYRCQRCGHEWVPRDKTQKPRVCPKCKNPYWDRPRKVVGKDSQAGTGGSVKSRRRKRAESSDAVKTEQSTAEK